MRHRLRAFGVHLALSAAVIGLLLAPVFFLWYPYPYWRSEGLLPVAALLCAVHVGLGPVLTLAVYRPGKKGLRSDLVLIVAVQLAAFAYGSHVIVSQRPAYLAFAVDRFTVVPAAALEHAPLPDPPLRHGLLSGPRLVVAAFPDSADARTKLMFETLSGGRDIEFRPEFYRPYPGPDPAAISAAGRDLRGRLAGQAAARARFKALLVRNGLRDDEVTFAPLVGKRRDLALVVERATARPLGAIDIDPW